MPVGPMVDIELLVVVEFFPLSDCFNVLMKLAQATGANRSFSSSSRKCSQKEHIPPFSSETTKLPLPKNASFEGSMLTYSSI